MKIHFKRERLFASICFVMSMTITCCGHAQEKVKKAVFIIVDGIPADVMEKLSTPNLKNIAKQGGYTRAYVGGGKALILKRLLFLRLVITAYSPAHG